MTFDECTVDQWVASCNLFQETKAVLNVERQATFQGNAHLQEVGVFYLSITLLKVLNVRP